MKTVVKILFLPIVLAVQAIWLAGCIVTMPPVFLCIWAFSKRTEEWLSDFLLETAFFPAIGYLGSFGIRCNPMDKYPWHKP